jgi:hypothetical protein
LLDRTSAYQVDEVAKFGCVEIDLDAVALEEPFWRC